MDPKPFSKWLAEQVTPGEHLKILELGCGTGELWKDLKGSFPNGEIILSDLSEGMLKKAKENFGEEGFNYEIIDFHSIPYPDKTFDILISNHNLYHALDVHKVLGEIARVMKEDGVFYSTTNSVEHLSELRELLNITDDTIWPNGVLTSTFGAEMGLEILAEHFQYVERRFNQNELRIKELAPIVSYFMSVRDARVHQIVQQSMKDIQEKFEAEVSQQGYFKVKSKGCLFICRGSLMWSQDSRSSL